jgi:hypothetical protein
MTTMKKTLNITFKPILKSYTKPKAYVIITSILLVCVILTAFTFRAVSAYAASAGANNTVFTDAENEVAEVQEEVSDGNFLRDGVFVGNQKAYDITMMVSEIVVGIGITVGQIGFATGAVINKLFSGGMCFVEGTAVLAASGAVAIEAIAVGDLVYAYDDQTGDVALKEVVNLFRNETYELTTVKTGDGQEIISTPTHPYYTISRGWLKASELRAGDKLLGVNGQKVVVEWVQHEIFENLITVYNFEVAGYHTYFVAESVASPQSAFVLVHNKCSDGWAKGSFDSPEASFEYHYRIHGKEVGAGNPEIYGDMSRDFAQQVQNHHIRGTIIRGATPGVKRYVLGSKYIDLDSLRRIISFGVRRRI